MAKVDRASIAELRSSMGDSFAQLAEYFVEDMIGYRDQLIRAFEASRFEEAKRIAHTVKSTSLLFGGQELSQQAKDLEDAFASGESIPDKLDALRTGITDHIEAIKLILPDETAPRT